MRLNKAEFEMLGWTFEHDMPELYSVYDALGVNVIDISCTEDELNSICETELTSLFIATYKDMVRDMRAIRHVVGMINGININD